eukprot:4863369-Prymnesium_polylepis.2
MRDLFFTLGPLHGAGVQKAQRREPTRPRAPKHRPSVAEALASVPRRASRQREWEGPRRTREAAGAAECGRVTTRQGQAQRPAR